jgi:GTP cyclohydrolase III
MRRTEILEVLDSITIDVHGDNCYAVLSQKSKQDIADMIEKIIHDLNGRITERTKK